jgi:hypothetical protein
MIVLQSTASALAKPCSSKIARHFSAGLNDLVELSPLGTTELIHPICLIQWLSALHLRAFMPGWSFAKAGAPWHERGKNHPKSTCPHPKSTVDLGFQKLIWGDNALSCCQIAACARRKTRQTPKICPPVRKQTEDKPLQAKKIISEKVDLGCAKQAAVNRHTPPLPEKAGATLRENHSAARKLPKAIVGYHRLPKALNFPLWCRRFLSDASMFAPAIVHPLSSILAWFCLLSANVAYWRLMSPPPPWVYFLTHL